MKGKAKPKREGPLSIPLKFDDAIKRVLTVKPPPEGWAEYERRLKAQRAKKKPKGKSAA